MTPAKLGASVELKTAQRAVYCTQHPEGPLQWHSHGRGWWHPAGGKLSSDQHALPIAVTRYVASRGAVGEAKDRKAMVLMWAPLREYGTGSALIDAGVSIVCQGQTSALVWETQY